MTDKHTLTLDTQVAQARKVKQLTAKLNQTQAELGKALDLLERSMRASGAYVEGRIPRTEGAAKAAAVFLFKHGRIKIKLLDDGSVALMETA